MPYIPYDTTGLTTIREAARQCGVSTTHFWVLARDRKLIDPPTTRVGHRDYYNHKQMKTVINQVAELRKKGVI